MERRVLDVGQLYGYAVCLVAVLICVFGSRGLVSGVLDIRELIYSPSYVQGPSLVSVGAYKVDLLGRVPLDDEASAAPSLIPSDSTFQQMFEAERLYRLALSYQTNRRRIVVNLALLVVAGLLFGSHWMWLRRRERVGWAAGGEVRRSGPDRAAG